MGGGLKKKKRGEQWREKWEKKRIRQRQRKWESSLVIAPLSLCCEEMREEGEFVRRGRIPRSRGWFMRCLLRCDLRVKERLFVECLLAGNLLHWFCCHIVVARRSVYMLAQGIKIKKCLNVYDSITMSLLLCLLCCIADSWLWFLTHFLFSVSLLQVHFEEQPLWSKLLWWCSNATAKTLWKHWILLEKCILE